MFGIVHDGDAELAKRFDVSAFPTLVAVCNGDESSKEVYQGDLKHLSLKKFINKYTGGTKCKAGKPACLRVLLQHAIC